MDALNLNKPRRRRLRPAFFTLQIQLRPPVTHLQPGTGKPDWIRLPFSLNEGIFRVLNLGEKAFADLINSPCRENVYALPGDPLGIGSD